MQDEAARLFPEEQRRLDQHDALLEARDLIELGQLEVDRVVERERLRGLRQVLVELDDLAGLGDAVLLQLLDLRLEPAAFVLEPITVATMTTK